MRSKSTLSSILTLSVIVALIIPQIVTAQTDPPEIVRLQSEIHKLNQEVAHLKAERSRSNQERSGVEFTTEDKQRIDLLRQQQRDSRIMIDAISLDIISISKQLKEPGKRSALAKKMRHTKELSSPDPVAEFTNPVKTVNILTARSIDLAAVKLVRNGKSLDQARLLTIEALSLPQVQTFYRSLPKTDRFELYDLADEIVATDVIDLDIARRSAIYFYLFTH